MGNTEDHTTSLSLYDYSAMKNRMNLQDESNRTDDETTISAQNHANNVINASDVKIFLMVRNYWPIGVIIRLVLPLVKGLARGWKGIKGTNVTNAFRTIRNVRLSRELIANSFAFTANTLSLGLSHVQVVHKFDPLLKIIMLRRKHTVPKNIKPIVSIEKPMEVPENCVSLNILVEPENGPIRADVIFIHGLHGSLVNTWKQGLWNSKGRRVKREFKRPPKPPVRPPKRQRHTRTSLFGPPHNSKRRRFHSSSTDGECANSRERLKEQFSLKHSYDCDDTTDNAVVGYLNEIEYNFSTFRMRVDDVVVVEPDNEEETTRINQLTTQSYSKCWPRDWLPLDCPGVRVIALSYTTDPYLWRPAWIRKRIRSSLAERSREMAKMLLDIGVGSGHPIVWVGHSKGGIFIKQMIVDAWECGKAVMAPIWQQSRGILFYSVPHRGSPLADFNLPLLRQSIELTEIKKDPGIGEVCGVHLDHREICKPTSRDCILYTKLTKMINKVS
ncbi:Protein SERAC1 [Pseudolycoriella hygida]|uniref:Protein SERAC1 n=1 Tax=Pseudolycoriella hygida TaxID=35572 RepID=A0A9Q0NC71_9DIPT|nr:Protein SERAC1 [Pseudolycoriella hygida]